ncbi:hypothetical protein [Halarchaeum sp. P4]|uniref:hypothetical protein n=1 Tax=Halarchaeum sp. P4 TaxID=3421639 RepID=UPI003EBC7025
MSALDAVRDHVVEHHDGMLFDLVFAIAWVVLVTVLFRGFGAPDIAYYLAMAGGVVAYYGFTYSLALARESE